MAECEIFEISCDVGIYQEDKWYYHTEELYGNLKELFGSIRILANVDSNAQTVAIRIIKAISKPTVAIIELRLDNREWSIRDTNDWTGEIKYFGINNPIDEIIHRSSPYSLTVDLKITFCGFADDLNYPNLYNDMSRYLFNPEFSDVKVRFQNDKEYAVHKIILATQSPVLENLLTTTVRESNANCIIFSDFEETVGDEFIKFLYQGKLEKAYIDYNIALKLLVIGTAYKIPKLFNVCSLILSNKLTVENVLNSLELSVIYDSMVLQERSIAFVVINYDNVSRVNYFRSFSQQYPELIAKIDRILQRGVNNDYY